MYVVLILYCNFSSSLVVTVISLQTVDELFRRFDVRFVNANQSGCAPLCHVIIEGQNVERVFTVKVVQDGDHRLLRLRHLVSLHGAADVDDEDDVLGDCWQRSWREVVNEVTVDDLQGNVHECMVNDL